MIKIKIKDKFTLSAFWAIIVSIPLNIIEYLGFLVGINNYQIWYIAASIYFPAGNVATIYSFIIGFISHLAAIGAMGILIGYLLNYTGTDYYLFKGMAVSLTGYVFLFGWLLHTQLFDLDPITGIEYIFHLILHIIFGLTTAWAITRFGKNIIKS